MIKKPNFIKINCQIPKQQSGIDEQQKRLEKQKMEQQTLKPETPTKSNPSLVSCENILLIQACQACHEHHSQDPHDQTMFYALIQGIHKELCKRKLSNVKLVKNKPHKYLALADGKVKNKYEYVNLQTKKVERFPRIGAFQVYYNNFVVFSLLKSSFKVTLDTQNSIKSTNSSPNIQSTGESQTTEKQPSVSSTISVNNLCNLIVQVIEILSQNSTKVEFLEKVENVFRFLQLEWRSINYQQSLIEYMLAKTPKENMISTQSILKPLVQLTQDKATGMNHLTGQNQSPKKILPYTYYKKGQKNSRMRQIYQDKTIKNSLISTSSLLTQAKPVNQPKLVDQFKPQTVFTKPQSALIKRHTTNPTNLSKSITPKKVQQCKLSFLSHKPSSSIKKINSQVQKSILVQKSLSKPIINQYVQIESKKPYTKQLSQQFTKQLSQQLIQRRQTTEKQTQKQIDNQPSQIFQQNSTLTQENPITQFLHETTEQNPSKPQGFIIKRHFKRTSIPKFQLSHDSIQPNEPQKLPLTKNCGFIYKNNALKEKLIKNQITFQASKGTQFNEAFTIKSRKLDQNIGKIFKLTKKTETETIQVFNVPQRQNTAQKIFKRTKEVKSVKNRIQQRKNPKNMVRNCFSQRRPLSSTIASKFNATKNTNINNLVTVSQKQIERKMFRQSQGQQQCREVKIKPIESFQNIRLSQELIKKSKVKRQVRISSLSKDKQVKGIQPKLQRKYSKDFVKQNIRKASNVKRVNSYGNSVSFWQNLNPSSKEKQQKKSFSYFKKEKCTSHVRTMSSNDRKKQSTQEDQGACENWDEKISRLVENCAKSKSNSSVSKSMQSYGDKESRKVVSQKTQDLEDFIAEQMKKQQEDWMKEERVQEQVRKESQKLGNKIEEAIMKQEFMQIQCPNIKESNQSDRNYKKDNIECIKQDQSPLAFTKNNQQPTLQQPQPIPQSSFSPFKFISNLFIPDKSPTPTALVTYTLASQDQPQADDQTQKPPSDHTKTTAYYNHQLYLSIQKQIKYEPAYVTYHLGYFDVKEQSERFAMLLKDKNFNELDNLARLCLDKEEIYQQFTVKSLRQLYKLDQLQLFPPAWAKYPSFNFQNTKTSNSQSNSSILYDTLHILIRTHPKLISRLFENVKSVSFIGYYGVWLYNLTKNKFELVIVDDEFCVAESIKSSNENKNAQHQFIFGSMLDQKSIWFMILQKAMAKLLGSYNKLYQTSFSHLFKIFTGCQYVEFKDLSLQKVSKIFTQKIFHNKKSLTYATVSQNSIFNHNSQELNIYHTVEKITGWNFNEKNPFLSLIHFESPNRRIQSVTMMDFAKQFQGITMVFFNPNFVFNHVSLGVNNSMMKSQNKRIRAIEITSNSYSKDNLCYISVTHGNQFDESNQFNKTKCSKKPFKTTLKLYKQVFSYDTQPTPQNTFNLPQHYQQQYPQQTLGHNFRYNGQITKSGEFFFEVPLKGGKNLCFIESDLDCLNIGFYSQERVDVKCLPESDPSQFKLLNGKTYRRNQVKIQEKKIKNQDIKIEGKVGQKPIKEQESTMLRQNDLNKTLRVDQQDKEKKQKQPKKSNHKKSHIFLQSRTKQRGFLQDQILSDCQVIQEENGKKQLNLRKSKGLVR